MDLQIKPTPGKGRGVFATRPYHQGRLIERAPIIRLSRKDWLALKKTPLVNYCFDWHKVAASVIALGFGSLYNHSYKPNAYAYEDIERDELVFFAYSDIKKGEEITINYNGATDDATPLWFTPSASKRKVKKSAGKSVSAKSRKR